MSLSSNTPTQKRLLLPGDGGRERNTTQEHVLPASTTGAQRRGRSSSPEGKDASLCP